jgi:non-canonical poly(A) RNA polymerase PAPD5/7
MNGDTQPKFRDAGEYTEDSDSEDDGKHDDHDGAPKRRKTGKVVPIEQPKWSNPDPYTALPPPSQSTGPKKDIVETIRKAKMDTSLDAASNNPVKDNIDFISFDDEPAVINIDSDDEDQASVGSVPLAPGRNRKRTHSHISPDDSLGGLITEEWEPSGHNLTPWMPTHADFTANVGLK